jgi:hypothetical protein
MRFIIGLCAFVVFSFVAMGINDAFDYADAKAWEHVETIEAGGLTTEVYRHAVSGEYKQKSYPTAYYADDLRFLLNQ